MLNGRLGPGGDIAGLARYEGGRLLKAASGCFMMPRLGDSVSGALRTFGFWLANGTVGLPLLEGIDYSCIFREPSALERAMAIYANVLRVNESGQVLNAKAAERRAAQWIRSYVDQTYTVDPPFENWETELHAPPGHTDIDPDAAVRSS